MTFDAGTVGRFWNNVVKTDGCWNWTGAAYRGQRQFFERVGGKWKRWIAHRASWVMAFGPIPDREGSHGACVLNQCGNLACVRPDHLRLGTITESNRLAGARRRAKK